MKKVVSWFFVIGSFAFLYFYIPEAMKDDKVFINEIITIALNVFAFLINLKNIIQWALDEEVEIR